MDRASSVPAHLQVRQRLLKFLHVSELESGEPIPSEVDIADTLGVSRMTANKAILGLVAEGRLLREKGRGTFLAEQADDTVRRCLILVKQAASYGLQEDHYYGTLYWRVLEFFRNLDIRVDLGEMDPETIEALPSSPDSVVIALNPDRPAAQRLASATAAGAPVVILGSSWEKGSLDAVDSDNRLGAALAVNHLVDLGHTRIAFVGALIEDSNTVDRLKGFQFAMKARGLTVPESRVVIGTESGYLDPAALQEVSGLLTGAEAPTAILAAGSELAMNVLSLASRMGIAVPESLSLVAYDDPGFLSLTHPAMTTVRQPLEEMAALACTMVMARASERRGPVRKETLEPALVLRESTARWAPHSLMAASHPAGSV